MPTAAPRLTPPAAALAGLLLAPATALAQAHVEVGWISRDPALPPPTTLGAPAQEGWPLEGDRVEWVGHALNRGTETVPGVGFAWSIDGNVVDAGAIDLPPGETLLTLAWSWTFDRHEIALSLEPPPEAGDASAEDDALAVASDALSVGFWVEQDIYDWLLEDGGPGFERVMQREIESWNAILARARHPSTPDGVLDRLRLETITIAPDGADLPNGHFSTDFRWFFRQRSNTAFLQRFMNPRYRDDQTIVLHELLHQRGLIDLYAYALHHGDTARTDSRVDVMENGRLVAGGPLMPPINPGSSVLTVYTLRQDGLMGTRYRKGAMLTEHSAFGLNLLAGRRTPRWLDQWGNEISLGNVADPDSYVLKIPEITAVRLRNASGRALSGARVDVYLDHSTHTYQNLYAAEPDASLLADGDGVVALPGDLLGSVPAGRESPTKPVVVILGAFTAGERGYAFVPYYDLNLLHFRGGQERAEMQLEVQTLPW